MKALRSHIFKKWMALLLGIGLFLPLVQPVEAAQSHSAFAVWLHAVVRQTNNSVLKHKLKKLDHSKHTIKQLIRQASQIIKKNGGELKLPFKPDKSSEKMYQILLLEWSRYQSGNAMAAVPPVPVVKPGAAVNGQNKFTPGTAPAAAVAVKMYSPVYSRILRLQAFSFDSRALQPLSSGIAIGAP